ncbi:hypothetical protein BJX68DRAFT_231376 [Aspergillus pseudodeflectus]|uniref:Secreted protein n=1 Tax=Aspergillus pseudodeflectus TaxID=176178 RepID=A0ABR4KS30_9EURO
MSWSLWHTMFPARAQQTPEIHPARRRQNHTQTTSCETLCEPARHYVTRRNPKPDATVTGGGSRVAISVHIESGLGKGSGMKGLSVRQAR